MATLDEIRFQATAFRRAIEESMGNLRAITLRSFPRGSCGDASDMLGSFLRETLMIQCDYVCGWANDGENRFSHGWLELGEVIIDITADQFDGGDKVIVSAMSAFHSQFEVSQRFPSVLPTNGDATDDTVADLRHDFELIKATLRKGGCKW